MSDLTRSQNFEDGDLVTALKLKNLIDLSTINPTFVTTKSELQSGSIDATTDLVLGYDFSTNTLVKIKVEELLKAPSLIPNLTATNGNIVTFTSSIINGQTNKGIVVTANDAVAVTGCNWVSSDGLTVTVTSNAHGLTSGTVVVTTNSVSSYSGDAIITVTSANQFTYTLPAVTPVRSPSAGTLDYIVKGYLAVVGRFKTSGKASIGSDLTVGGNLDVAGTFNLAGSLNIANKPATQSFVPAGAVMPFANNSVPAGWLKANGQLVSRTTYADLYAAIGVTYGAGDGSTTFALPDLRGEFIRGFDDGRSVDTGRAFGSSQSDLLKKHKHISSNNDCRDYSYINGTATGSYNGWCDTNGWGTGAGASLTGDGTHGVESGVAGTSIGVVGNETRPRNLALLYCIKY